ncbi:MAG: hypothetical protein IKB10_00115 [Alphaproteobacteria bacterium]|nr:hypothetical protein [Alphaproteobacteria bacterium]
MSDFIKTQNSFASGEIAPEFYMNDQLHGLSKLENMDIISGGGISRRPGLTSVAQLPGAGRLISMSVSDGEEYLIVLADCHMYIYHNNNLYQDLITPWSYDDLANVQYAQRFGTMIFVHPDYRPMRLYKTPVRFYLADFDFSRNDSDMTSNMPFIKFEDTEDISITVTTSTQGNNFATFTTSQDFWTPESVNTRLYLLGRQWVVMEYISPIQVIAHTNGSYDTPTAPVTDWQEAAFSNRRGWPRSITFHQNRLVFGGSRDYPSGVWMSHVGKHTTFSPGTGLDDEAIFISLLSQQRQQICTVVSSDNLQILTNVGEWAISSKPLTPSSVDIKQHTSIGSYSSRYMPPQNIEGSTVFVSASGRDIRELSLDDIGEKYNANDLCMFAKHLMNTPTDIAYNHMTRQLFVVCDDGNMAVLNQNASVGISGWAKYITAGRFVSVGVVNNKTYVIVLRDGDTFLEYFDSAAMRDAGTYDFTCIATAVPMLASGHGPRRIRLRRINARIMNTKFININDMRVALPNDIYDVNQPGFSGDVSINCLGTHPDSSVPVWTISSTEPYPLTVLSVGVHGWYTV